MAVKDIPNPCKKICSFGKDGVCSGCFRTGRERTFWFTMTDTERNATLDLLAIRQMENFILKNITLNDDIPPFLKA